MSAPDRITLVLRAVEGGSLDHVLPFVQLGAHVSAGRGLAVIAGASQGDLQAELEQQADLHLRAVHAHEMLSLLRLIDAKCGGLDALLAHNIEPSEEMWQQSREAMEAIGPLLDKLAPGLADSSQPAFSIDDHVRMTADARRYRRLRDRECIEDPATDLLVLRGDTWITGDDLDREIDTFLRLEALQQPVEQQP